MKLLYDDTGRILYKISNSLWSEFPFKIENGKYWVLNTDKSLNCKLALNLFDIDSVVPPTDPSNVLLKADINLTWGQVDSQRRPKYYIDADGDLAQVDNWVGVGDITDI